MEHLTFDQLPKAVSELNEKLDKLISLQDQPKEEPDKYLSLNQLINYLPEKPARQTVYGWVNSRKIPYHKEGKQLLFRKSEIDQWLRNGRRKI